MTLRLKDIREDRDMTQKQMATLLNCTQPCYSMWENGKRDIPIKELAFLAAFFHVSTDYILGLTNEPSFYPTNKRL